MTIGERLKIVRGSLSQRDAAARIGMKQQSWRVYETNASAPGATLIQKICAAFGVSSDWLLGIERDSRGIVAHNSTVVIGSGVAINDTAPAPTRAPAYGKEIICRKCPFKRQMQKIARLATLDPITDAK